MTDTLTHTKTGVISATISIASCFFNMFTQSNIAWFVGVVAGLFAIYNSYLSIKEKKIALRKHQNKG